MRIFLVGFMGCGKSSLGRRLSKKLNYDFIDTDVLVEQNAGERIQDILFKEGESKFREYERDALLSAINHNKIVVATGGGTPCYSDNMDHILKMGTSVYLRMSPASLAKRIENSNNIRPILKNRSGQELLDEISNLLSEREKYYLKANCIIKGENAKPNHIVSLVFG